MFTESSSLYSNLETKSTEDIVREINHEDQKVAKAVEAVLDEIARLVDVIADRICNGGRLFYIGAGTSGRLGVLDASEIPPTYGMPHDKVIAVIAGGDTALRFPVENAEDDCEQGWHDLLNYQINSKDVLVGLSTSGTTPYVYSALKIARNEGIFTACITCNPDTIIETVSNISITAIVGPEYVTGSTRMKSGTAQKMILNIISTTLMIRLGRVEDNKMVYMQLSNEKLRNRALQIISERLQIDRNEASRLLDKYQSVQNAIAHYTKK